MPNPNPAPFSDRDLVCEVLVRLREAEQESRRPGISELRQHGWLTRARAFDEVYTELKGRGYDGKG